MSKSSKIIISDHNIDFNKWNNFIQDHPKGNIFQTSEMFEIYNKTKYYEPIVFGAIDINDNLVGVLLVVIQKEHNSIIGKFSSRSIIMGGPIVKNNDPEITDLLLKSYNKKIKGKAIYTQIRNLDDKSNLKIIFEKNGFMYEPHLDILINLNVTHTELNNSIKREKRRNFTKSTNKGVKFKKINDKDELINGLLLISSTYKRVKLPMPDYSLFINAFKTLHKIDRIKVFGAYSDTKIIGIRIILAYKELIFDWFAGSDDERKNLYPNDFLILNILFWGIDNTYKVFDFGGAGNPNVPYGVRDHKMKFGGDLVEFGRFNKVHNKILFQTGKIGLKIYKKIM